MALYRYGNPVARLEFTIEAVPDGLGGADFTVHVITGSLNFNALYWSDGDINDSESFKLGFTGAPSEASLNMLGANVVWADDGTFTSASQAYDGAIKLSDAGLGNPPPATYLIAGGSDYSFNVAGLDLSQFSTLGVRATSTSTQEGSIKWVDDDPVEPPPPREVGIALDKQFINVTGGDGDALADAPGDILNYTVTVTNTGDVDLTNVTVVDPLTGQNIAGVTLAPGASQTFNSSYTLTQADLDGAGNAGSDHDIDNIAIADSEESDPVFDSSVPVPLVYDPSLAIDKQFIAVTGGNSNGVADVAGDVLNYTVAVTNTGNVTLTGVTVVDPLTGQNIAGVTLAPGASQTFTTNYTLTPTDIATNGGGDGLIQNTVIADSNETEAPNDDTETVPLVPPPPEPVAFDGLPKDAWSHDGKDDIVWQDFAGLQGDPQILLGEGTAASQLVQFSPWPTGELPFWKMQAVGDFNGDGNSEIIWQHDSNNLASLWLQDGTDVTAVGQFGSGGTLPVGNPPVFPYGPFGFDIKAAGDFDGDGDDDVIAQQVNGNVDMWVMNGSYTADAHNTIGPFASGALAGWEIKGTGDFNGDGKDDIIWQGADGTAAMWLMDGTDVTFAGAVGPFNPGTTWEIKGVGDFDGDGKDDLVWQHDGGQAAMWLMDGTDTTFVGAVGPFNPGSSWEIKATGDLNDDGMSDIIWQGADGTIAEWQMNGTQTTFVGAIGMSAPGVDLFTGDFNAGGEVDWSVYSKTESYETVFGVDAGGNLNGDELQAVLNQPAQGNPEVPLAQQAVTALLNETDGTGMVTESFRFTTNEVISAVQEVYDDGGFDAVQGADLTNLLQFWNEAPEANIGPGATTPGELHSNDTTAIATTLTFNGTAGGSFEGNIFDVLGGLHPDHGWVV
jgi:uncharacterized repeat protein (TIGR01451 family)